MTLTGTLPVKSSICVTLLRITPTVLYKRIIYAIVAGSMATVLIADIVVFAQCHPMAFTCWYPSRFLQYRLLIITGDRTIVGGECSDISAIMALSYVFSAMNVITDWGCAILPVFIIKDIQMPVRLKVSISCILGLGVL